MKWTSFIALLTLVGCGYEFSPKEIAIRNAKGDEATAYSCGSYMHVSSIGWINPTYEVTFTDGEDGEGLTHTLYEVKEVGVADIPTTVDAPFWGFAEPYVPGERYSDKPDGTPGAVIKEGDIVVKGSSQARLMNGKWTPVKIPNPACSKA